MPVPKGHKDGCKCFACKAHRKAKHHKARLVRIAEHHPACNCDDCVTFSGSDRVRQELGLPIFVTLEYRSNGCQCLACRDHRKNLSKKKPAVTGHAVDCSCRHCRAARKRKKMVEDFANPPGLEETTRLDTYTRKSVVEVMIKDAVGDLPKRVMDLETQLGQARSRISDLEAKETGQGEEIADLEAAHRDLEAAHRLLKKLGVAPGCDKSTPNVLCQCADCRQERTDYDNDRKATDKAVNLHTLVEGVDSANCTARSKLNDLSLSLRCTLDNKQCGELQEFQDRINQFCMDFICWRDRIKKTTKPWVTCSGQRKRCKRTDCAICKFSLAEDHKATAKATPLGGCFYNFVHPRPSDCRECTYSDGCEKHRKDRRAEAARASGVLDCGNPDCTVCDPDSAYSKGMRQVHKWKGTQPSRETPTSPEKRVDVPAPISGEKSPEDASQGISAKARVALAYKELNAARDNFDNDCVKPTSGDVTLSPRHKETLQTAKRSLNAAFNFVRLVKAELDQAQEKSDKRVKDFHAIQDGGHVEDNAPVLWGVITPTGHRKLSPVNGCNCKHCAKYRKDNPDHKTVYGNELD